MNWGWVRGNGLCSLEKREYEGKHVCNKPWKMQSENDEWRHPGNRNEHDEFEQDE